MSGVANYYKRSDDYGTHHRDLRSDEIDRKFAAALRRIRRSGQFTLSDGWDRRTAHPHAVRLGKGAKTA